MAQRPGVVHHGEPLDRDLAVGRIGAAVGTAAKVAVAQADVFERACDGETEPAAQALARDRGLAHCGRFASRSSTTLGSASVDVSPRFPTSPSAILRKIRRM